MRLIRAILSIIGMIGVLVILALFIGYYLFCLNPPIRAEMHSVMPSQEGVQSLDQKLESFETSIEQAVDAGEETQVSLAVTEKEVNSKLADILAGLPQDEPLEDMLINFGDNYFLVYAVVDVPGVDAKTGAKGRIQVVNGTPEIVIHDYDLGKLPLPQVAGSGVEGLLNIMLSARLGEWPLEITGVEIANQQLTVFGLTETAD